MSSRMMGLKMCAAVAAIMGATVAAGFSGTVAAETVDEFYRGKHITLIDGYEAGTGYSELVDPVIQRERLVAQSALKAGGDAEAMQLDEFCLGCIVADDRPALTRCDVFIGMEAEANQIARRTDPSATPRRADRMRSVLDHPKTPTVRDVVESIEVDRQPREMHRQNRARPRTDA